ncbi:bifunctional metallophosphatase/5'-nucleotidase [Granulosicoccus antarcticus]|uniref:Trifunctional nucleotide phosphoesterase protein YfkN n=1 Tax=Granulosicoccus antarcticus IMCC3135 TaxID=1192854 RepID=A0A2Z2NSX0_9GAMM|nr:bifunctional metallophosphatase/5'-nucleotidase [Granulosicoccus antarcticus]ASJ74353.1 Trifunctional nucleotide phosphoesterase protein YfkN [Granulosicoccus antarcticus IMCC3135]
MKNRFFRVRQTGKRMNRRILPCVLATSALSFGATAIADDTITILHTNDFHSRVEPITKYDSPCSAEDNTAGECFGGFARLVTAVSDARKRNPDALLFDGGDQFQGSLFYTYYKGKVAAEIMNTLQYDGMTVGNHEFDDGPLVLRSFIDNVEFPVVMSNADVSKDESLANKIMKSTVVEKAGKKYGIIGLTPQDTGELASPGKNITFSDPVAAVQGEVDELTAQGINRIVVLSHSGYEVDKRVAAETTGVDVIVGGHSNTFLSNTDEDAAGPYPTMVGDTAIVQAYAYGKYVGELAVTFNDAGEVMDASGDPISVDGTVSENAETVARVTELAKPLESIRNKVVAVSDSVIEGSRDICRLQECEMGNLIADALLDRVKDQGVSIAIMNSGGVRATIDAGEITMGEVLTVLPFQNTLSTFELTGADVIAALENGVSQVEEVKGRFPQVAGLSFTWDPSKPANEGRIVEVLVDVDGEMQPIDPEATYGLVSNNYVRGGGDGYSVFAENALKAYDFGPNVEDVVADYLAANAPYKPALHGRISQL